MLLTKDRTFKGDMVLGASTALTAGMTNISGAIACYLFTANVTGHVTNFANHLISDKKFEMVAAFGALVTFFMGAFAASFLIRSFEHKGMYKAFAAPFVLEIILLVLIAFYGLGNNAHAEYYEELLAAGLLFSMGLQNSSVTVITGGSVKSSHLTGLVTDLGNEAAQWLHPSTNKTDALKNKLRLRLTILACYIAGGIIGGLLFIQYSFAAFFYISGLLALILAYDLLKKETAG